MKKSNVLEEINERKLRENNLIVFGIPEKDEESKEERDIADKEKLNELFKDCKIQPDMENLKTVKRLGKFNKEKLNRPILVKLPSAEPKITLFKSIHYIKANSKYAKVGVGTDGSYSSRKRTREKAVGSSEETNRRRGFGGLSLQSKGPSLGKEGCQTKETRLLKQKRGNENVNNFNGKKVFKSVNVDNFTVLPKLTVYTRTQTSYLTSCQN
ncbi:unnamed protein product [Mytilus coruscus]|uniref:Uncharacterized protein n=1 Tax=Mytilus coruscus TaxID=42192 RepID=A0A6J8A0F2_MYTCO|nr:unnamed protein product [Mytilus coruscus]